MLAAAAAAALDVRGKSMATTSSASQSDSEPTTLAARIRQSRAGMSRSAGARRAPAREATAPPARHRGAWRAWRPCTSGDVCVDAYRLRMA